MKSEPGIEKSALVDVILQQYGLIVETLTFLPGGEVGHHYIADCRDGSRYFVKFLSNSRLAQISASRLDFYLTLMRDLYDRELFRNLACPLRTRLGELRTIFGDRPLVLFHYIEGETLWEKLPYSETLLASLARLVARLHKNTPEIRLAIPFQEKFEIPFEAELESGLEILNKLTSRATPGKKALCELLLPHREAILGYLARLNSLGRLARLGAPEMVLCHTDLNQANLIQDLRGDLFILDWEGAMLAPPEHDLFIFAGGSFPSFLEIYEGELGLVDLDADRFGFYFYRRNLEDLTDFVVRILYENNDDEQDQNDLVGIQQDCISGWSHLETDMRVVKTQLDQRN
jgi:spectinomycin phosphotransferase